MYVSPISCLNSVKTINKINIPKLEVISLINLPTEK